MSSTSTAEARSNIDLSELLTFNVGFKNLELLMRNILTRLEKLEDTVDDNNAASQARDDDLTGTVDALKGELKAQQDAHDALGKEVESLADKAAAAQALAQKGNERADDAHRRIDELEKAVAAAQAAADAALVAANEAAAKASTPLPVVVKSDTPPPTKADSPKPSSVVPVAVAPQHDFSEDIEALRRSVAALEQNKADKQIEATVKSVSNDVDKAKAAIDDVRAAVDNRCAALGSKIEEVDHASQDRDDELSRRIGAQAPQTASTASSTPPPVVTVERRAPSNEWMGPLQEVKDALKKLTTDNSIEHDGMNNTLRELSDAIKRLKADGDAANHKLAALAGLGSSKDADGNTGITPAQFALLRAAVESLEKRPLAKDYDAAIQLLNEQVRALGNETSSNTAECKRLEDKKANKSDVESLVATPKQASTPPASTPRSALPSLDNDGASKAALAECNRRIDDSQRMIHNLEALVRSIDPHKIDRSLRDAADDIKAIKARLDALEAHPGSKGGNGNDASSADRAFADAMQKELASVAADSAKHMDWTKGQVLEIRATIEHIHHTKADTALVANKAERDFVENSMEKLMREVEQVLNATNAGLIDTLDKSLNILRDMIDGKATKQDVIKLQTMINEDQTTGAVPEGLMGYKGYRCLGCNRTMEGMRQRPMGSNFSTFMNRLPSGTRQPPAPLPVSSAGAPRVAGPSPPAGYIANAPVSR